MYDAAVWCALALALLGHSLLWTGVVNRLHGLRGPRVAIKLATVLCVALFIAAPIAAIAWLRSETPSGMTIFAAPGWLGPYVTFCAIAGAVGLPLKLWVEHARYDRRVLVSWTAQPRDVIAALGKSPLVGAWARTLGRVPGNEVASLVVDRKRLALPGLPPELAGLTIAHISDLHISGRIDGAFYQYIARAVNDLRPDVIAITGDIIENEACRPWLESSLATLCAPLGVFYILGNHDYFIDAGQTRQQLDDAGLCNLAGRWVRGEWNGVPVVLAGNEQPWGVAAPSLTDLSARPEEFRVALCHSPDQFPWCRRAEIDLALAGHTHGGQVQLPLLGVIGSPSLHGTRYACGVFRQGRTVLHVTRGVSSETPIRWRCPPEIALLELAVADSGGDAPV